MLEQTWEERLAEILKKEPAALSQGDIEFLRARRSYLSEAEMQTYAEVLGIASTEIPIEEISEKPKTKKK